MKSFNSIISKWSKKKAVTIWVVINLLIVGLMDKALFSQTTPQAVSAPWHKKLMTAEKWALLQWLFIIPSERLGNKFLTVPQLGLTSFLFDFVGQIVSNIFWLKIPITIDDWTAMSIITGALYISIYKVFG